MPRTRTTQLRKLNIIVALLYALLSGYIIYVRDYTAGDQALIPLFFSLIGLLIYIFALLIGAVVCRIKKRKDIARELSLGGLWSLLIYIVVMVTVAIATS